MEIKMNILGILYIITLKNVKRLRKHIKKCVDTVREHTCQFWFTKYCSGDISFDFSFSKVRHTKLMQQNKLKYIVQHWY